MILQNLSDPPGMSMSLKYPPGFTIVICFLNADLLDLYDLIVHLSSFLIVQLYSVYFFYVSLYLLEYLYLYYFNDDVDAGDFL